MATKNEPFVARLFDESSELYERIVRLRDFMSTDRFLKLPQGHQVLLCSQFGLMTGLLNVLNKRLELLDDDSINGGK